MNPTDLDVPSGELVVGGFSLLVMIALVLFLLLFVAVVVVIAVVASKRYRAAKRAGLDPFAADIQVMGTVAHSAALAPERPMDERLAELDRLRTSGTITTAERDTARARILGGL